MVFKVVQDMMVQVVLIWTLIGIGFCTPRRGVGLAYKDCNDVLELNVSFWYDWHWNYPCSTNIVIPWIPMIFNASDVQYAKTFKGSNYEALLGFNEPNAPNQANMTVNESLILWPQLMEAELPLCSPAPDRAGAFTWLKEFMDGIKERNYRVDYLCFHWYAQPKDTGGINDFKIFLQNITTTYPDYYGKIWLTEFGNHTNSTTGNIQFFNSVYSLLTEEFNGLVQRYSWFTNRWKEKPDYGWDLINSDGIPTQLGKDYRSKPK